MISILIITLLALVAFLLLTGFGIMRDFSRLWLRHSHEVFCNKQDINYYGELAVTLLITLIIATSASLLKGGATILVAMVTTNDIAQFTTALRGVFSSYTTELQSSRNHLLLFLLNPALKMLAVIVIIYGIRSFFNSINTKAGGDCYEEADVFYFSSIGVMFLVVVEILCRIQDVKMANTAGNIAYLLLDKFSYILFLLTAFEVMMLRSNKNQLNKAVDKYLVTNHVEKKVVLSGWKMIVLAYAMGLLLSLPYFLGLQWIKSDSALMSAFIIVLGIAILIMKKVFAESWNLLGTVVFASTASEPIEIRKPFGNKLRLPVIVGLITTGALLVAFGIAYPKQLFMLLLIMAVAICLIVFGITAIYFLTTGISYLLNMIVKGDSTTSSPEKCFSYIGWVLASLPKAIATSTVVVALAFMAITCFPKELKCDDIFVNSSVVDTNGNWLYIDENYDHYYAPLLYDELPEFLKKALVYQEDRYFFQQNNLLPNTSNWHGISLSVFRGRGGSNINAQLVKNITFLDADGFPRDMSRKLAEMVSGYMVSQKETPEEIIEKYVNVAAFHGTFAGFRGLNAASLYAFGKPIGQLNQLQQLYLINTLPRSVYVKGEDACIAYNAVHTDSTGLVKKVLLNKAERWYNEGLISKKELNTLKRQDLAFTNCRYNSGIPTTTRLRFERTRFIPGRHLSYITLENEQAMVRAFNDLQKSSVFKKNGAKLEVASIVVDVHNGHIIAHHSSGMIDYTDYRDGFPIGSLSKPFIVTQMLEMGASPNFTLFDGPVARRKTPKNANHGWKNRPVTITEALSQSLNAPFTNIREIMDPKPVFINTEGSYRHMGIRSEERHAKMCEDTYNYPLGLRQMYVTEVAQAFQTLMADGMCYPLSEQETVYNMDPMRIYEAKNVAVVKQALSHTITSGTMKAYKNMLPQGRTYYAKTGTSTRQQYGWAVVSDGDLLVVSLASYGKCQDGNMELGVEPLYGGSTAGLMSVLVYNEIKKIQTL